MFGFILSFFLSANVVAAPHANYSILKSTDADLGNFKKIFDARMSKYANHKNIIPADSSLTGIVSEHEGGRPWVEVYFPRVNWVRKSAHKTEILGVHFYGNESDSGLISMPVNMDVSTRCSVQVLGPITGTREFTSDDGLVYRIPVIEPVLVGTLGQGYTDSYNSPGSPFYAFYAGPIYFYEKQSDAK